MDAVKSAVYKLLNNDVTLTGLCTVYKGSKRPGNSTNPSVTIESKGLKPGEGEGIWMCDVIVTTFADVLANRMADYDTIENIISRLNVLLTDMEIVLTGAKALPLIEGGSSGPDWSSAHAGETMLESVFGLIFIDFGN